jgi:hypothetical protein
MTDTKRPDPDDPATSNTTAEEPAPEELTDEELEKASGGARYGDITLKRGVVNDSAPLPTEQISLSYTKITHD